MRYSGSLVVTSAWLRRRWRRDLRVFIDRELWARLIRGHPADDLLVDLLSALRCVCDPCIGHALSGPFDNLVGLAHAALVYRRVSNDANRVSRSVNDILDAA